jgi:hypothetical protein
MLEVPDLKSELFLIDSLHLIDPSTKILPAAVTTTEPGGTFKAPMVCRLHQMICIFLLIKIYFLSLSCNAPD